MDFTIHQWENTPTKSMQLHYAEETSHRTFVRLVSTRLLIRSCKLIVQLRRKQSFGQSVVLVRYSYNLIYGIEKQYPVKYVPGAEFLNNPQPFQPVLDYLLHNLSDRAASVNSPQKFAAGRATVPGAETIYALVQCTPDIDKQNCSNCLKDSILEIEGCCGGKKGGRVLKPSCSFRYEINLFFRSTANSLIDIPAPVPAAPAPKEEKKKSNIKQIVITIVVVLVAFVTILSSICIFLRLTKRRVKLDEDENSEEINLGGIIAI
ncbi:putative receptor-like protein kinase [Prunus yedoensis var. nudiflora]|uniref:Putative receptor-like protein kinase n=1 Tax=Prunus yedoensis var. nudiflora TaxID=2094558 RepID=A0A314XNA2_PRUYE|nr:putative receptor-like protein kinase [Prunus yedoensis var. nudiflora]